MSTTLDPSYVFHSSSYFGGEFLQVSAYSPDNMHALTLDLVARDGHVIHQMTLFGMAPAQCETLVCALPHKPGLDTVGWPDSLRPRLRLIATVEVPA